MKNPADLPRLPLEGPEQLDRAVTQAFWTLKALIEQVRRAEDDEAPSPEEQRRRRALMRSLAERLGARVCTPAQAAPRRVQGRGR
jgi:hypothetical protein